MKKIIVSTMLVAILFVPMTSSAQTVTDVEAQKVALLEQVIELLKQQLAILTAQLEAQQEANTLASTDESPDTTTSDTPLASEEPVVEEKKITYDIVSSISMERDDEDEYLTGVVAVQIMDYRLGDDVSVEIKNGSSALTALVEDETCSADDRCSLYARFDLPYDLHNDDRAKIEETREQDSPFTVSMTVNGDTKSLRGIFQSHEAYGAWSRSVIFPRHQELLRWKITR